MPGTARIVERKEGVYGIEMTVPCDGGSTWRGTGELRSEERCVSEGALAVEEGEHCRRQGLEPSSRALWKCPARSGRLSQIGFLKGTSQLSNLTPIYNTCQFCRLREVSNPLKHWCPRHDLNVRPAV